MPARNVEAPSFQILKAAGRATLRSLAVALNRAQPGESVHGARRQIKQVRSLLRLVRTPLGKTAFTAANTALRDAADALAGQRRAEALVAAAERLGGSGGGHDEWLQLATTHRDVHAADAASKVGLERAQLSVAAAAKVVGSRKGPRQSTGDITAAFLSTYRKARRRMAHALESEDAAELHEARKQVIHHIHHLQLLRAHLRDPSKRLAALEKLREALGDLNDLDELAQLASSPPTKAGAKRMVKRRGLLLRQAGKTAGRVFRDRPKAFQKRIGAMWPSAES